MAKACRVFDAAIPEHLSLSESPESAAIMLPERCDLKESEVVFDTLSDIATDTTVVIDASDVTHMSTPCVLAIISAIKSREAVSPPAVVVEPSQPFIEAFQTLGLYGDMMKMEFRT